MAALTYPDEQHRALVRENAIRLSARYATFVAPPSQVPKRPALAMMKERLVLMFKPNAPPAFDWRDRVQVPPAKSQGDCYSCTSFAVASAIEISLRIADPANRDDVAAQFMHTCVGHAGKQDPHLICRLGVDSRQLLQALKTAGYASSINDAAPFSPSACAKVRTVRPISDFFPVSEDAAKSWIMKGPLVADMYVWDDFFGYTTSDAPMYIPTNATAGPYLHTVCVVGFSSAGWIVKNSLGSSWGDGKGFATIAKGTCGLLSAEPLMGGVTRQAYLLSL